MKEPGNEYGALATCSKCVSYLKCSFWLTYDLSRASPECSEWTVWTWYVKYASHGFPWRPWPSLSLCSHGSQHLGASYHFFLPIFLCDLCFTCLRQFISANLSFLEHHNRNPADWAPHCETVPMWPTVSPITHSWETTEQFLHDLVFSRTWGRPSCPNLQRTDRLRVGFFLVTH